MTPIIPSTQVTVETPAADQAIPFDVTLAVANTSEVLFTVPVGKLLRGFSLVNRSAGNVSAHISMAAGAAATTSDTEIEKRGAWGEMHLALAEGDYEFIGSTGAQPSVQGVAWVSDA